MKKLAALLLAATMCVSVTACGSSTKEDTSAADNTTAEDTAEEESASDSAASDKVFNIGICQLVQHEALDAATKGFEDALVEEFGEDGVKFDEQNAQGDSNTCSTIINGFVSNNVDLILANATASLQAAAAGTNEIPILGTAVTEYGVALELSDFCLLYTSVSLTAAVERVLVDVPVKDVKRFKTELLDWVRRSEERRVGNECRSRW